MIEISSWAFVALLALPMVHAGLLPFIHGDRRAQAIAASGAVLTLVLSWTLLVVEAAHPESEGLSATLPLGGGHALHFAIDGLSGLLLALFALLTLAFVIGSPRGLLATEDLRALLWLEGLTFGTLATDDLLVLCVFWSLLFIPLDRLSSTREPKNEARERSEHARESARERAVVRRVFRLYHGLGLVCFLIGCVALIACSPGGTILDARVLHSDASLLPERMQPFVFAAFAVATLVRMGVAPFHSWLPLAIEHRAAAVPAALVAMRTGLYVLVRVAIPAFPAVAHAAMPSLTAVAFCSAIYGALAALGQRNLRRMIGFFMVSQSGIMLTGIALGDATAVGGTLLYWLGFATAITGLVLMLSSLEARIGSLDMRATGGIVRRAPLLTGCFFMFGLASIAIPGSVAFVAEDMLVHGALQAHPLLTLAIIAAMVLNAVTFVRAFGIGFLGDARAPALSRGTLEDLLPRERATAIVLLVALIAAGLVPGPLIAAQARAAQSIAVREQTSHTPAP